MKKTAVLISGYSGAGKSTLRTELAKRTGWANASFGDEVRRQAKLRGLDETDISVLQDLGQSLVEEDALALCLRTANSAGFTFANSFLLDGIRHVVVLNELSKLAGPERTLHVHMVTDSAERQRRLAKRGVNPRSQHPVEGDVDRLANLADLVLDGTIDLDENVQQVLNRLESTEQR
ncbi:MAG TPA: AAA family ATPase [Candidatus Acidoferrales bacterium]|nr:AAA family ATPase [Candidatus Acidoferrales bacterium]